MEQELTAYLFRYMLREHFSSKSDMARKLRMGIRQMQNLFYRLDHAKGGTIALNKLLYYCVSNGIALDPIICKFMLEKGIRDSLPVLPGVEEPEINLTSGAILSLMVPDTLSEQGIQMAKSVMRIVQAMEAVSLDHEDSLEEKLGTIRRILDYITTTAYEYILKIYTEEVENSLDG